MLEINKNLMVSWNPTSCMNLNIGNKRVKTSKGEYHTSDLYAVYVFKDLFKSTVVDL